MNDAPPSRRLFLVAKTLYHEDLFPALQYLAGRGTPDPPGCCPRMAPQWRRSGAAVAPQWPRSGPIGPRSDSVLAALRFRVTGTLA